ARFFAAGRSSSPSRRPRRRPGPRGPGGSDERQPVRSRRDARQRRPRRIRDRGQRTERHSPRLLRCRYRLGARLVSGARRRGESVAPSYAHRTAQRAAASTGTRARRHAVPRPLLLQLLHVFVFDGVVEPAYVPWGWMANIDGLGGPLPDSWIDSHITLEKQILARERSLGMTPVL